LFCLNEENKSVIQQDCRFGANLIAEKYSVKKMSDDAYSVYQKAVLKYKKTYDFALSGYYGYGNIGDDALLFTIISNILQKKHDLKICVLVKNSKQFQKSLDNYFCNIIAKPRFNFFSVRKAVRNSDALVFGGGTLLQNITSNRSLSYYLSLIKTAQKYNKKTILYANGIGPICKPRNYEKIKSAVKNITLATIRDESSYNYLLELLDLSSFESDKSKIYLTADEALTIKKNNYLNAYKKDFGKIINGRYIVVSVRKWKYLDSDFFIKFSAGIDAICREYNLIPVYVVMQPKLDKDISYQLSTLNGRAYLFDACGDNEDTERILAIIKSAEAVISMRLHALIFAAAFGVPMLGISYDAKVKSFLEDIFREDNGGNYTIELKDFSKEILIEKFKVLMTDREALKNKITEATEKLCEKAETNVSLFLKAMEIEIEIESETDEL
jgi:polysaccharide pyruvyl transferase CsaB